MSATTTLDDENVLPIWATSLPIGWVTRVTRVQRNADEIERTLALKEASAHLDDKNYYKMLRKQRKAFKKERSAYKLAKSIIDPPGKRFTKNALRILQNSLFPDTQNALDYPIFISIDFEYRNFDYRTPIWEQGLPEIREAGISVLDVRDPKQIISSHYRTAHERKKFLFGTSIYMKQDELLDLLRNLFFPRNQDRKFILVGHSIFIECQILKRLGIDLALAPSVEHLFDTFHLGAEVFGDNRDLNLSCLTGKLGIPGTHFHNAGNDANFTLRAMLLLALHDLENNDSRQWRYQRYNELARYKLPPMMSPYHLQAQRYLKRSYKQSGMPTFDSVEAAISSLFDFPVSSRLSTLSDQSPTKTANTKTCLCGGKHEYAKCFYNYDAHPHWWTKHPSIIKRINTALQKSPKLKSQWIKLGYKDYSDTILPTNATNDKPPTEIILGHKVRDSGLNLMPFLAIMVLYLTGILKLLDAGLDFIHSWQERWQERRGDNNVSVSKFFGLSFQITWKRQRCLLGNVTSSS